MSLVMVHVNKIFVCLGMLKNKVQLKQRLFCNPSVEEGEGCYLTL